MKWKTPFLYLALPLLWTSPASAQGPDGTVPLLTHNGAGITISNGAEMTVRGQVLNQGDGLMTVNGTLRIEDWLTNNGTSDFSTGAGSVIFFGPNFQSIGGSHLSNFPTLTVSKSTGTLLLDQDVSVEGNLVLDQGGLDLNGHLVTLSATSSLQGENDTKYVFGVTGKIAISLPLNAPSNLNVANLGAVITSNANLGTTTVIRSHEIQTALGEESIQRYYEINPVNNSNLNATLEFRYMTHELNGQTEDKFVLYRSENSGATWEWGGGTVNPATNIVLLSGIGSFSRWTVSNKDTNPISGLEEVSGPSGFFSVYPNPAALGQPITLGLIQAGDYWLEVIDSQGKVVSLSEFSSSGPNDLHEFQPALQSAGMYYLLLRDRSAGQRIYAASSILIH